VDVIKNRLRELKFVGVWYPPLHFAGLGFRPLEDKREFLPVGKCTETGGKKAAG
jgi:hypothetical protein